jgi:hypothetical protein
MPTELTRDAAKHEARKRRASERHAVGCYKELGRLAAKGRGAMVFYCSRTPF